MRIAKNKDELFKVLKGYMELEAMSRYEEPVVEMLKANTKDCGFEYSRDGMGSLIMNKGNKEGPKIMVAAHMDEVGFLVQDIEKNGQIKLSMVGGVWPTTVIGSKAKVITSQGKEYVGVFGHTSIHILEKEKVTKAISLKDMYVDIGAETKEEVLKLGIEPADRVYLTAESFQMQNKDYVVGKAMDNRAGITIIDQVVKSLANEELKNDTYIVGTVQEEVGTRGARTSVSKVKPDVAIAIDTCASHDTFGAIKGIQKLGQGIALRIKDGGTMMDPKLVEYIYALTKKHNIPAYKFVAQGGGTDAAALQFGEGGVATITLSIPQRYLHSPHGVSHLKDIQAGIDLIVEFIKSFDQAAFDSISYK